MKDYKSILAERDRTAEAIKEAETEKARLNLDAEKTAARDNYPLFKELCRKARANAEQIAETENKIKELEISYRILTENAKHAITAAALDAIEAATAKYNGKQYGPKTKSAIYEEVKKAGIAFFFKNNHSLQVELLTPEGFTSYDYSLKCNIYGNYSEPFITAENKLDFKKENAPNPYRLTENPAEIAKEIIKAYKALEEATKAAKAAQDYYNSIIPDTMPSQNATNGTSWMY